MLSLRRGSVARRLAAILAATGAAVRNRNFLREQAAVAASIGAAARNAGIDPARIRDPNWRKCADAAGQLSRLGEGADRQRRDADFIAEYPHLAPRWSYAKTAAARVADFAGQAPPDYGAAVVTWYAWSLAVLGRA